jgi:hypothetical protein
MIRLLAAVLVMFSSLAMAATPQEDLVEKWYAALVAIDRSAFEKIIADDALISLGDLDIEQTKKEFIESLDEWQDAMKGASIRHKIEEASADTISIIVCYTFPDNESLGREVFRFKGDQISESVQSTIGDTCAEY